MIETAVIDCFSRNRFDDSRTNFAPPQFLEPRSPGRGKTATGRSPLHQRLADKSGPAISPWQKSLNPAFVEVDQVGDALDFVGPIGATHRSERFF
jgi:hypothetical protein